MKVVLALVLMMACSYVSSDTAHYYCGRRLSDVLAALCWEPEPEKRTAGAGRWYALEKNSVGEGKWLAPEKRDAGAGRWLAPAAAARSLVGGRGKRGPVDECCFKPCTVAELMTYC